MKQQSPANSARRKPADSAPALKPHQWAYLPVALVALLGVLITNAEFVRSLESERSQVETAFREAAEDRILVVQGEIKHALDIVQDLASFFEASQIVGRRDFRKFVGPFLKRYAGVSALGWIPVVSADDRSTFVAQAQRSFPPFRITDANPSGAPVESPNRPVHYPILYIQPYSSNKASLGIDAGTDPVYSALLREAERSRDLRISPGVRFDDNDEGKKGIIAAIPVFFESEEAEDAPPPPGAEIRGFAFGVFYIKDIVEQGLANLRSGGIDLDFYQQQASGDTRLLYTHLSRLRKGSVGDIEPDTSDLTFNTAISVGDQQWKVVCDPAPGKFRTEIRNSWATLATGLAFTALLTAYLITLIGRTKRVRQEVDVRTSQLWDTVQDLNREVTERKFAERELQRLNETLEHHIASRTAEAERRAQYLEQFAYVTSHDLKAPLRAVSNLAGWIEEDLADKLDDASREQMALLRDRVLRMHNLIEGLLEYSRVGKTDDTECAVDTRELITEIIDSLAPPSGFKIKVQSEMPTMYVDRLQLGQVFSNLISNSLKHHGRKKGKIWVTAESQEDLYEFSVCDNGKGIAPEYHDKIFMMFQTLASGDFENSTGIGLALVKKIVEENGGTIRVESALGKGACFRFTWPKTQPQDQIA